MVKANKNMRNRDTVMGRKIVIQVIILVVFILTSTYAGQDDIRVGPSYSDQDNTLAVVVELPVTESPAASQFRLAFDNQKVGPADDIRPFKLSGKRLAIVLCIDVSGSIGKERLIEIQKALNALVVLSRPEDLFALVSFADHPKIESGFKDSRDQLKSSIRGLTPRGDLTRIYEALDYSLKLYDEPNLPLRRRVIIISDGNDEGSRDDQEATWNNFTKKGVVIDAVARGKIDQIGEVLHLLANETGGQFEHALPARLSVKDALTKIYTFLLRARSMVVYFNYERAPSRRMTGDARIELAYPGEASSHQIAISTPIPRPKSDGGNLWLMVLPGLLIIVGIVALVIYKHRKGKNKSKTAVKPKIPADTNKPQSVNRVESGVPAPGATRIGGYHLPEPAQGSPAAILLGVSGSLEYRRFPIEKEQFYIGADARNDLCIADDEYVSGEHAYLRYQQGRLFVHDCKSRNGTLVNQVAVTDTGLILDIGDRIRVGESTFVIEQATD
jgi:hypothetical protein